MCGIAGLISKYKVNPAAVELMTHVQSHRGPDSAGKWLSTDEHICLGHRRLSILDLSSEAAQPMASADHDFVITYNGEIYNYIEVMAELKLLGSVFRTKSDTEVIIEAYRHWGEECVTRLNGMFAFALYDKNARKVFCARDRFGEKPFLFAVRDDFIAFASEYKALLSLAEVATDYDELKVLHFLYNSAEGLDDRRQTVFHGVLQLLPGEALTINVSTLDWSVNRYWDLKVDANVSRFTEADATALFKELLIDSVRIRMRSDVPVGSCLSGGLDSSSIVCIARQLLGDDRPYHVFTGRFPNTQADEWVYAEKVIASTKVEPHVVEPTPSRFMQELEGFIWHNELPVGSTSQFAQWCVFSLAKENGITVLLDGQGGDELLGGYEQYFSRYIRSLKQLGEHDLLAQELPLIKQRYPLALLSPAKTLLGRVPLRLRHWISGQTARGSSMLFGLDPAVAKHVDGRVKREDEGPFDALKNDLYKHTFQTHLPTLLRYGDRNSMAHSREVRLPFCDHRLAELAFSLPPWYLMGEVQTKRLLRESMRGLLPEEIRTRWNKQGFLPPQTIWFQNGLLDKAEAVLSESNFVNNPVWEASWWRQLIRRLQAGESHLAWVVWKPFISELWRKHFVDRVKTSPKVSVFATN